MTTTLINPVTAEAFTEVPATDLAGTDAAIERAHEAFLDLAVRRPGRAGAPAARRSPPSSTRTSRSWPSSR